MLNINHVVVQEHKKHGEFKKGEIVSVKTVNKRDGLYEVVNKGTYKARLLKGILSPVEK